MADYKIELGVKLDTSDLKEQIRTIGRDKEKRPKVSLGVDLKVSDIQKRIQEYNKNANNIKVQLKAKLDTDDLKKQISKLDLNAGDGKGISVPVNTKSLEDSLKDVKNIIEGIRKSIGSLDDGNGMKSLVTSVNQIATALEKATNESDGLVASLSALSKKDFSVNFGLNMGSSNNPVARNAAYGKKVRGEVLPQLKEQLNALVKVYNDKYKQAANHVEALDRLVSKTNLQDGNYFEKFMLSDDTVYTRMSSGSLSTQMQAYKEWIDLFKKAASLKGLNIDAVTSQFSKSTDDLIKDAQNIQAGASKAEDGFEKIKQVFSGGIDAEALSGQLQPIVADLGEIKIAIQELASGTSLDGLIQSFDKLSGMIENLLNNLETAKKLLNTEFSNTASTGKTAKSNITKTAQQTGQKIGETIEKSVQQSINLDDVIDEQVADLMKRYEIAGEKGSKAFNEIRQAIVKCRNELNILKNSDTGIDEEVFDTSSAFDKITKAIAAQMRAVDDLGDEYIELANYMTNFNDPTKGNKVCLPDFIKQEQGDDYKSNRGSLGIAFNTKEGISFADFINDLNHELGETIDLTKGEAEAFEELIRKVKIGREQRDLADKSTRYMYDNLSPEQILELNGINREEIRSNAEPIINAIDAAEQKIAQSSTEAANIVVQNEERKQRAYQETATQYDKISRDTSLVRDSVPSKDFKGSFDASNQAAQEAQEHFEKLLADEKAVVSVTEQFDDSNALQSFVVNVQRASGEVETLRYAMEDLSKQTGIEDDWRFAYQGASSNDSRVEKQLETHIKKANDLQTKLDKIKSGYSDTGATKPIKDVNNIAALEQQYEKVKNAIIAVRNADNSTFSSMVSNAEKEKAVLENMVREFRNAENVSTKMKGTDLASGIEIAKNDLGKFKAQAKDFPQIIKTIEELDRAIESVGDKSSLDSFTDQLKVARAELAKVKAETIAAERKKKVGIDVSGATSRIANIQRISPEIDDFKAKIDGAEVTVESLLNDLSKVNTAGDFSVVNRRLKAFEEAAESAGIAVKESVTKINSVNKIKNKLSDSGFNGFKQEIQRAHMEAEKFEGSTIELEVALKRLDAAMREIYSANQSGNIEKLVAANEKYEDALKRVYSQIKLNQQEEKDDYNAEILAQKKASLNSDMEIWLKENTRAVRDFGEEIRMLQASLDGLDDRGLKLAGEQFKNIKKQAQVMGKTGLTVFDKLKSKAKEYMVYLSAAELFMYAEQALRAMFDTVKEIDTAMTGLYRVTNLTAAEYDNLFNNMIGSAKEYGATLNDIINATTDWVRAGFDANTSLGLAEVTTMYQHISDLDYDTAAENLITAYNGFKDELNGAFAGDTVAAVEYIADIFNELDRQNCPLVV